MRDASIVYMSTGLLLLRPPGRTVFHEQGRSEWPKYPPDPEHPGYAMRVGEERHWTRCGLLHFDSARSWPFLLNGVRRDNAELVGRPCRKCWP